MSIEKSRLRGSLVPQENRLRGKGLDLGKQQDAALLKIGDVVEVNNLEVQTPVARMTYSGKLTLKSIREKGEAPRLRAKGDAVGEATNDRHYTFFEGDTEMTCTVSETRLREHLKS